MARWKWPKASLTADRIVARSPAADQYSIARSASTCLSPVMSDEFGHLACNFGMRRAQSVGDMLVELLAGAPQHALIGRIAKQLVSEPVLDRLGIT